MSSDEFGPLPEGWSVHVSRTTQKRYWSNCFTRLSVYERPVPVGWQPGQPIPQVTIPPGARPAAPPAAASSSSVGVPAFPGVAVFGSSALGPKSVLGSAPPPAASTFGVPVLGAAPAFPQAQPVAQHGVPIWSDASAQQQQPAWALAGSKRVGGPLDGAPAPAPKAPRLSDVPAAMPGTGGFLSLDDPEVAAALTSGTVLPLPPAPAAPPFPAVARPLLAPSDTKASAVAAEYDAHVDLGREAREASKILHMKRFNNWVKATLIAAYAPKPAARVLDLACGKLGDLQKWRLAGVTHYTGIDISSQAVHDAAARFSAPDGRFPSPGVGRVIRADLGAVDLTGAGVLAPGEKFDAISIQFALHYLFQSERRALTFFRNIAGRLNPGGVFVGTIPDAAYIVRRLRNLPPPPPGATSPADEPPAGSSAPSKPDAPFPAGDGFTFGNSVFSVTFTSEGRARQAVLGSNPFGVEYDFYLAESVRHAKEYLVPWELLERLAASAGLVPLDSRNFHAFYEGMSRVPEHRGALASMRVFDARGSMSPDEWEAAGVYRVFAFRAPVPGQPLPPSVRLSEGQMASLAAALPPASVLVPGQRRLVPAHWGDAGVPFTYPITSGDIFDAIAATAAGQ